MFLQVHTVRGRHPHAPACHTAHVPLHPANHYILGAKSASLSQDKSNIILLQLSGTVLISTLYTVAYNGDTCCVYVRCALTHRVSASVAIGWLPGRYALQGRAAAEQGLHVDGLGLPWKPMGRVRVRWWARR